MSYIKKAIAYHKQKSFLQGMCLMCLLVTTNVNANITEALDSADVATMLSEVEEAVQNKDSEGLVLFIDSLYFDGTSIRVPKHHHSASSNDLQHTSLLNQSETKQLFELLEKAVAGNSYAEFRLINKRYAKDSIKKKKRLMKLATEGSAYAALAMYFELLGQGNYKKLAQERASWLRRAADLGSPYAAYLISTQYLNKPALDPIRLEKEFPTNKQLGFKWSEKALLTSNPLADPYRDVIFQLADLYNHLDITDHPKAPKQAFLFKLMGCFSPTPSNTTPPQDCLAQTYNLLKRYRNAGLPSEAVEAYGNFWCDEGCDTKNRLVPNEWKDKIQLEFPTVLSQRSLENAPIFTLQKILQHGPLSSFKYRLNFYKDGRVTLLRDPVVPDEEAEETSWKLAPATIAEFAEELRGQGFETWKLANYSNEISMGITEVFSIQLNTKDLSKTVHLYLAPKERSNLSSTLSRVLASICELIPLQRYTGQIMQPRSKPFPAACTTPGTAS